MSVAWSIYEIVAEQLKNHAALAQLITVNGKVQIFNSRASANAVLPYIVLGDATENVTRRFTSQRTDIGELLIHGYSSDLSTYTVLLMHRYMVEALDQKRFQLMANRFVVGSVSLVTTLDDQDGQAMHGITRFSTRAA